MKSVTHLMAVACRDQLGDQYEFHIVDEDKPYGVVAATYVIVNNPTQTEHWRRRNFELSHGRRPDIPGTLSACEFVVSVEEFLDGVFVVTDHAGNKKSFVPEDEASFKDVLAFVRASRKAVREYSKLCPGSFTTLR